ncbi:hypothetical protein [Shewanella sp. MEBiC00475]|uniref:hypothetical protein n=1 Tax=Shewanella sp. MEBiC00475 TaxID=2575361 RepID=UPI0010BFCFC7|nr:hypothetical protein [Shewanella sp. MEBiC00475]
MTISVISINEVILNILKDKKLQQISAVELKKLFMDACPASKNKQATQLVHRTLNKLCRYQFFEKVAVDKKVMFSKTAQFDERRLSDSKSKSEVIHPSEVKTRMTNSNELKATLNQYQIDLLGLIGEAEEFKRLINEYPEAKTTLYPRYMRAKNQSSTMVGKINAIEVFINSLEGR